MNKVLLSGLLLLLVACNDEVVKPNPQEADSSSGSLLSSSSDEVDEESTVPVSSSSLSSSSEAVSKISSSSAQANGSVGCKPTTVAGFTTWCGDTEKNPSHVSTGLDNGNGKSGYWSFYNDNSDGGLSLIKWHCDLVPTWSIDQLEPIIDDCGGLCGTFALDNGSLDYNPFVGVGFAVAGYYYVDPSTADASEWDGLCVAYSSDLDMTLELSLGADGDKELAYDIPSVSLQKSSLGTVARFTWDEFKQMGWGVKNGGKVVSGAEAAKTLAKVNFKMQAEDGFTGRFNIMSVGPYQGGCGITAVPASSSSITPKSSSASKSSSSSQPIITDECVSTTVGGFKTWCGSNEPEVVWTGLDDGKKESGYWYTYADDSDGGGSHIDWAVTILESDDYLLTPVIEHCGGLCGSFTLDKGSLDYNPFVGLAFNVAGSSPNSTGDASEWEGLCVTYSSDLDMTLELSLGADGDHNLAYDNPYVSLNKSRSGTVARFTWDDFEQSGWGVKNGGKVVSGAEAAKTLASVKFKIQGKDGSTGNFNIMSVGPYQGGCGITTVPASSSSIKPKSSSSSQPIECVSTTVGGFKTWCGSNEPEVVMTGLDDGKKESGYWYTYADDSDGGGSHIDWAVTILESDDYLLTPVIEHCGGLCGTFTLDKGSLDYNPFVGLAFNVAGSSSNSTGDASEWEGLCVAYSSDLGITLELSLGEKGDKELAYDNPSVSLQKSSLGTVTRFTWDDFEQSGWGVKNGGKVVSGAEAAKTLSAIMFRIQGKDGSTGNFNIMSVGPYQGGCGEK